MLSNIFGQHFKFIVSLLCCCNHCVARQGCATLLWCRQTCKHIHCFTIIAITVFWDMLTALRLAGAYFLCLHSIPFARQRNDCMLTSYRFIAMNCCFLGLSTISIQITGEAKKVKQRVDWFTPWSNGFSTSREGLHFLCAVIFQSIALWPFSRTNPHFLSLICRAAWLDQVHQSYFTQLRRQVWHTKTIQMGIMPWFSID